MSSAAHVVRGYGSAIAQVKPFYHTEQTRFKRRIATRQNSVETMRKPPQNLQQAN